ncbi:MAG TPA: MFS transporter [Candidatus Limnocylindria bacterium]|jgi:MFS family permease|nr:MFS transporter [Candidatus Limnocylindria bacterium]
MTLTDLTDRLGRSMPTLLRTARRPDGAAPLPAVDRGGGFRRGFSALRHPNYRRYWFGQLGSVVGSWMQSVALPWLVLQLGGSPIQLGLVMALMYGPSMFFAPLGGVLADRVDKRRTLIAVNSVSALQAAVLFVLAATGAVEIWHVYALAVVAGFANAVEMPVRQAFVAELVPREDLVNAIALSATMFNLSRVVGPAVAGVTIAVFGVAVNFGVNAVSYLSVIVGMWLIDRGALFRSEIVTLPTSVRSSLAEGLRYARATPTVLWPLVLLGSVSALAMNFQTLLPLYARNTLGLDSGGYGALFATMGVGSLAGSLLLAFATGQRPLLRLITGGGAAFLALAFLLGFVGTPLLAFPLVIGIGLASMLMVNTINVTVQNSVPDALRGRVMSLYVTVFAGTAPIGGLVSGSLAQALGAAAAFSIGAAAAAVVLAFVAWRLRSVQMPRQVIAGEGAPEAPATRPARVVA